MRSGSGAGDSNERAGATMPERCGVTIATMRTAIGASDAANTTGGLIAAAAGAAVRQCVRQQWCEGFATETQQGPPGSVIATNAITSKPTRTLTAAILDPIDGARYVRHQTSV